MTGFAAATWLRGVRLSRIANNTLLMVDTAIGEIKLINHPQSQNLVAFIGKTSFDRRWPLPMQEFQASMAEGKELNTG